MCLAEIRQTLAAIVGAKVQIDDLLVTTTATNPATTHGYGTWVPYAAGRVMVGIDTTDPAFDVGGEVGGGSTHTITPAELP